MPGTLTAFAFNTLPRNSDTRPHLAAALAAVPE